MRRILSMVLAAVMFSFSLTLLSGCGFLSNLFDSISFSKEEISVTVGETINMQSYIEGNTENGFKLSSSNDLVAVVINQSSIKIMSSGKSTIKAQLNSSTASITVNARYANATQLSLHANGDLLQQASDTKPLTFFAVLNEGAKTPQSYEWFVNGQKQAQSGSSFTLFAQNNVGDYKVLVQTEGLSAEQTLIVYSQNTASLNGPTQAQLNNTATYAITDLSEVSKIEFSVNGQLVQTQIGTQSAYVFNCNYAGTYKISATVNGNAATTLSGEEILTLNVEGDIYPHNLELDYFSAYPAIYLTWHNRDNVDFSLTLQKQDGSANTVIVNLADEKVDLSSYVDVTDTFSVGSIYEALNHTALSPNARDYLFKKYTGGRLFIRNEQELRSMFEYMIIFRPNKTLSGNSEISKLSFFMAYNHVGSIDKLSSSLLDNLNITGSYRWQFSGNLKNGTVNELSVTFYTAYEPTDLFTRQPVASQLIAPQLSKVGRQTLPVEAYPLSPDKVSSSDQLFYTLEKGYKPDLVASSAAYQMYQSALSALKAVTDESMSEAQTALAIYDYIMFLVTYDYEATYVEEIAQAVKKGAYYLEGVFDMGFAVCDGIAKAFSLMCNMAGIDCVRVTGLALSGGWFNHAWNKVRIEGKWYTADATWDIAECQISGTTYKLGSKDWFLLGEHDYYLSRYETGSTYPRAEIFGYNFFAKTNAYLYDTDDLTKQLQALNSFINTNYTKAYSVQGVDYSLDFYSIEVGFSPTLSANLSSKLYQSINKNFNLKFTRSTVIIAVK